MLCFPLKSTMYPLSRLVKSIVEEKENRVSAASVEVAVECRFAHAVQSTRYCFALVLLLKITPHLDGSSLPMMYDEVTNSVSRFQEPNVCPLACPHPTLLVTTSLSAFATVLKVRETMRIMGLLTWAHELSWLVTGATVFAFIAVSITMLLSWTFLPLADGSLLLCFMLSFTLSEVGLALLVAAVFSKVHLS